MWASMVGGVRLGRPSVLGTLFGLLAGFAEWLWRSLVSSLRRTEKVEAPRLPALPPAIEGYLAASVAAPVGFGGAIPEDCGDGPASTDSEEEDTVTSWSFKGQSFKGIRDASFRKRDDGKLQRARVIQARSGQLASHLVTPQIHNRRVREQLLATGASPLAEPPRTVGTKPRKLEPLARGEPLEPRRTAELAPRMAPRGKDAPRESSGNDEPLPCRESSTLDTSGMRRTRGDHLRGFDRLAAS